MRLRATDFFALFYKGNVVTIRTQTLQWLAALTTVKQVDHFIRMIWEGFGNGSLADEEAAALAEAACLRRSSLLDAQAKRLPPTRSYFPIRPTSEQSRQQAASGTRCPDRWARKRGLGSSASMPPHLLKSFTEGARAVMYIIAADCRQYGSCRSTAKELADRAGVGLTTVRNALRKARELSLVNIQHRDQWRGKHLSNIVTIACIKWLSWLKKFRPNLGFNFRDKGIKKPMSTDTHGKNNMNGQPSYNRSDVPKGGFQPFAKRKPSSG